ncbi:hypothetical protein [uncultured Polaribacter sp.]|uniref:hypothetical protein n=1 Tax=uncultured Polaribacter sp. TaxID=174711 RepID=UPI00261D4D93|nr:hypothetical protein [uncultured Polaribacter sp.]
MFGVNTYALKTSKINAFRVVFDIQTEVELGVSVFFDTSKRTTLLTNQNIFNNCSGTFNSNYLSISHFKNDLTFSNVLTNRFSRVFNPYGNLTRITTKATLVNNMSLRQNSNKIDVRVLLGTGLSSEYVGQIPVSDLQVNPPIFDNIIISDDLQILDRKGPIINIMHRLPPLIKGLEQCIVIPFQTLIAKGT